MPYCNKLYSRRSLIFFFSILFCFLTDVLMARPVLKPVSFENFYIDDFYWYFKFKAQKDTSLPSVWHRLEKQGTFDDKGQLSGVDDADLYLLLETMSYIYMVEPDSVMKGRMDRIAGMILRKKPSLDNEFRVLDSQAKMPRMYQIAAFYRAAVAYHKAGGKMELAKEAFRHADVLCRKVERKFFPFKKKDYHPYLVLALGDLFMLTDNESYLKASRRILRKMKYMEKTKLQAAYYAAEAWICGLSGDSLRLEKNLQTWEDAVNSSMRLTGSFSADRQLCDNMPVSVLEAIDYMEWSKRLYYTTYDVRCMDLFERSLYNELCAGISYYGDYVSDRLMLPEDGRIRPVPIERAPVTKLLSFLRYVAMVPETFYALTDSAVYIHHYSRNEVKINHGSMNLKLRSISSMPWYGGFYIDVVCDQPQTCSFYFRVPSWVTEDCLYGAGRYQFMPVRHRMGLLVNGSSVRMNIENGFLKVSGTWKNGDRITYNFHAAVLNVYEKKHEGKQETSHIAFQRGPFVYCLEENPYIPLAENYYLRRIEGFATSFILNINDGVQVIDGNLYSKDDEMKKALPFRAIPYFSWNKRGRGKSKIWFRYTEK